MHYYFNTLTRSFFKTQVPVSTRNSPFQEVTEAEFNARELALSGADAQLFADEDDLSSGVGDGDGEDSR